jgi:hypothetical protein
MEVDLVVTPELRPTKHKVTFDIYIFSSVANDYGEVEGVALIIAYAPTKVITHFGGVIE